MLADVRAPRYELIGELATGGMATVYLGRQHGPFGFTRTVAIKSMHPQFAKDDEFRAMFLDEATLTARIRHPNVVPTLDVVHAANKLLLVMEYVDGASLSALLRSAREKHAALPVPVCIAIASDVLGGLQAAHELADEDGRPLGVVHRDVSPHNVHVGIDGLARVLDFGIAKARGRRHQTRTGEVKGKLAYMAPEQLFGEAVDHRADVYGAGVVLLWESLAGRRLFDAVSEGALVAQVTEGRIDPPSLFSEEAIPSALDAVVLKALAKHPGDRWTTAEDMARALEAAVAPAPRAAVKDAVRAFGGERPKARELESDARAVLDVLTQQAAAAAGGPSSRRRRLAIMLTVACVLVAAGATAMMSGRRSAGSVVQSTSMSASMSAPSASNRRPEPPEPARPPEPAASAAPAASVVAPPPRRGPAKKTSRPPAEAGAAPSGPARADCQPPYTVDAEGHRHYKAECMSSQ